MRTKLAVWSAMVLAGLALAGCDKGNERQLQGWVEAELVFISSDEQGRVENLKVREGDQVKQGDLLFAVDDDLHRLVDPEVPSQSQLELGRRGDSHPRRPTVREQLRENEPCRARSEDEHVGARS